MTRRFRKSVIDLHVVTNVWSSSCRVRYVVCNITVKLTMNSGTDGIATRIRIGKVYGVKIINKQAYLLTSKQLAEVVLLMTLK